MKNGLLIALEGPDGSGKSTQIKMLSNYLENKGYKVLVTREPGGTKISENIRNIILDNNNAEMSSVCEALLYAASRAQLIEEVIKPALEDGTIVLCDRFVYSSIVYQGIARGIGVKEVQCINDIALNGIKADLTLMINVEYEKGLERKSSQRKLDRLESCGDDFHKKVYNGYQQLTKEVNNIVTIDGNNTLDYVHNKIVNEIESFLK